MLLANPIRGPLGSIGERLAFVAGLADDPTVLDGPGWTDAMRDRIALDVANRLIDAPTFLWLNDIFSLADKCELPRHIVGPEGWPHESMYWTWEGSHPARSPDGGHPFLNEAIALLRQAVIDEHGQSVPGVLALLFNTYPSDRPIRVEAQFIEWGATYPLNDRPSGIWPVVLRLIGFLNSRFVEIETQHSHIGPKKNHGRRIGDPQSIQVVRLRPSVRDAVAVERGLGPRWKSRWLVRGHFKAQWYPGSKTHKVIWIAPYIKGPDGAPLTTPTYAVVR
jgi:hypothetical protein